jgi:hypothetical protein
MNQNDSFLWALLSWIEATAARPNTKDESNAPPTNKENDGMLM